MSSTRRSPGRTRTPGRKSETPYLLTAAVSGVGTFLLGYVFTMLLKGTAIATSRWLPASVPTEKLTVWMFYKMHNVAHTQTARVAGVSRTRGFNPRLWPMFEAWLFLVPPLLLAVAGFLLATKYGGDDSRNRAYVGAGIAVGYFPIASIGAVLAEHSTNQSTVAGEATITTGPKLLDAALLAGVVYPVVFGAIGGIVASVVAWNPQQ